MAKTVLGLLWVLLLGAVAHADQPTGSGPHIKVELIAEAAVPARDDFWVGLRLVPDEHWHVYWKNPGDSGMPPSLRWKLPSGVEAGEILWPRPKRLPQPPLMDYGYEGPTLLMVPIRGLQPGTGLGGGYASIAVRVDWLVCSKVCIPGKAELRLDVPVAKPRPEEFARARTLLPLPATGEPGLLEDLGGELAIGLTDAQAASQPAFFPAEANQVDGLAAQTVERVPARGETPAHARLKLKKSDQLTARIDRLQGLLEWGPSGARTMVEYEAHGAGASMSGNWMAILQALVFAFLGGLVLNLMPCVFPVLSIKVLAFMSQKDHKAAKQRRHGLLYAAGVLVSFWVLTGALLGLRAAGQQIGWGFQLQSPVFVAVLAGVLFFFGLSLAGVFELGGSFLGIGSRLTAGEGDVSSFFTGVLATVVATPCTAPMMGSAVGFALAQPVPVVIAVFTSLALGLALPYVALAWFPHAGRWLPKPGRWMETFKQAMAFPVFGTVVWLVWVFGLQTDMQGVLKLLFGLLLLGIGGWLLGRYPASRRAQLVTVVLAAAALALALQRPVDSKWEPYTATRVAELRAKHEPVFLDFTAAWCVSCKVNELVALQSSDVVAMFERKHVHLIKGDWTSNDPQITAALAQFGRSGVPFYVLYYTDAQGDQTLALPEVLTPQIVLRALEKIP